MHQHSACIHNNKKKKKNPRIKLYSTRKIVDLFIGANTKIFYSRYLYCFNISKYGLTKYNIELYIMVHSRSLRIYDVPTKICRLYNFLSYRDFCVTTTTCVDLHFCIFDDDAYTFIIFTKHRSHFIGFFFIHIFI